MTGKPLPSQPELAAEWNAANAAEISSGIYSATVVLQEVEDCANDFVPAVETRAVYVAKKRSELVSRLLRTWRLSEEVLQREADELFPAAPYSPIPALPE